MCNREKENMCKKEKVCVCVYEKEREKKRERWGENVCASLCVCIRERVVQCWFSSIMAGFYKQRVISFCGRCALSHCLSPSLNTELLPATWASRDDDLQEKKRGGEVEEVKSNVIIQIWYTCT